MVMALPIVRPSQEEPPTGKQFSYQLAAAVRSINWSYAIFWSISTSRPGVLTWKDGFYNGEIKTRKVTSSADLTADQLLLQRSEQLRELYQSLLSGQCDHRGRRPAAALSPEDLGDAEWYYAVCMSYAFRPGQGLPGRSFASNEPVWLCNAQCADTKTFQRSLLAKTTSIQTVACIPLMGGVLELGTTDTSHYNPDLPIIRSSCHVNYGTSLKFVTLSFFPCPCCLQMRALLQVQTFYRIFTGKVEVAYFNWYLDEAGPKNQGEISEEKNPSVCNLL
uniref:Predicted protein n=1 Tax=Hordeum vulgare subsp. vulgare TaxID=112509 RepID=F2DAN0_HORVV|nr:predicted protein [Hordeum vulgare subsp. vulgare]